MTTPVESISGGVVVGLSGAVVMGAPVEALGLGLMGAVFSSVWLADIDNRAKAFVSVALSTFLAGWGAPVASEWVTSNVAGIEDSITLHMLLALVIGAVSPIGIPLALVFAKRFAEGGSRDAR